MKRFEYAISLKAITEEGGFVANCRDLPQMITQEGDVAGAEQDMQPYEKRLYGPWKAERKAPLRNARAKPLDPNKDATSTLHAGPL